MDKQKQIEEIEEIEEMAKALCKNTSNKGDCEECGFRDGKEVFVNRICYKFDDAINLYNLGYRKIPEGAVVLTREEYDELQKGVKTYNYTAMFDAQNVYRWEQGYLQGSKDTAKEICDLILEHWEKGELIECDWLRVAISERYGVEVE